MSGTEDVLAVAERMWTGGPPDGGAAAVMAMAPGGGMAEVADGVAFVPSFANVAAVRTGEGLVLVDVGSPFLSGQVHRTLRAWSADPLHTAVYSHGHIDHVFGVHRFEADAEAHGWPAPRVVAHEAVAARFDRYVMTAGYNAVVNRRQFGIDDLEWPTRYRYPDLTFRDRLDLDIGGVPAQLHHARGETDDHAWTWFPTRRVLCTGDLFIWASPNAGNPQKVQRFPLEWAEALRRMLTLFDAPGGGPEVLLPGHGYPDHRRGPHPAALTETAELLESLVAQTLELMNAGARLDEAIHRVVGARPPAGPALPAAGLRRARVRGAGGLAPLRRLVGRQPGHAQAGPRGRPRPRAGRPLRRRRGAGRPRPRPAGRPGRRRPRPGCGPLRLAGHLAELAWLAAPGDPAVADGPHDGLHPAGRGGHVDHGEGRLRLGGPGVRSRTGRPTLRRGSRRLIPKAPTRDFACPAGVAAQLLNSPSTPLEFRP